MFGVGVENGLEAFRGLLRRSSSVFRGELRCDAGAPALRRLQEAHSRSPPLPSLPLPSHGAGMGLGAGGEELGLGMGSAGAGFAYRMLQDQLKSQVGLFRPVIDPVGERPLFQWRVPPQTLSVIVHMRIECDSHHNGFPAADHG